MKESITVALISLGSLAFVAWSIGQLLQSINIPL